MADNIPLQTISYGDADWAQKINANFLTIMAHDHSDTEPGTGKIVSIEDVSCVSTVDPYINNFTYLLFKDLIYAGFVNLSEDLKDRNTLFVKNEELYYANQNRAPIRITNEGKLDIQVVGGGGFTGTPSATGASVAYNSGTDQYHFFGNAGGDAILNVNNIFCTTATIADLTATQINFTNISFTNISPAAPGDYLLFEGSVYDPQFSAASFALFATNATSAQNSILQTNFVQALVETDYETDIFCSVFKGIIHLNTISLFYVMTPHTWMSDRNAYQTKEMLIRNKYCNLFFSIYNRDGNNLPVVCSNPKNNPSDPKDVLQFDFNSSFNKNLFTPLIMKIDRTPEI